MMNKKEYTFDDLVSILKTLRGENGCPWDRVQTHESIKMNLLEEAYEALEALSNHHILCCPLLLLPSIFSSVRVFSNESALCIRWPKY